MKAICIKCWNPDALVKMHLDCTKEFECAECEESFTCQEVKEQMEAMQTQWTKLLKWVDAYPEE